MRDTPCDDFEQLLVTKEKLKKTRLYNIFGTNILRS